MLTKVVSGACVEMLSFESLPLFSGQKNTLKFHLADAETSQPMRDLIPYLGAWEHMLILREDQTDVVHSHPEEQIDSKTIPPHNAADHRFRLMRCFPRPAITASGRSFCADANSLLFHSMCISNVCIDH
ncbi:MAG: hypothetical protein U0X75_13755 [Acidobacteriota bacterium]